MTAVSVQWGAGSTGRAPDPPFAWSLSSWLADFFQSSMRSCSGLMRLSRSALWAGARGSGPPWRCPRDTPPSPTAAPTHLVNCRSLVSMLRWRMHMRVSAEPISRVAPGEASAQHVNGPAGASAVPASGHEGAHRPAKAEPAPRAPPPSFPQSCRPQQAT